MKLKKLRFTDVLSHVDTQVDIADCLTVFTGVSESGKSAVIRGLDQLLRNHPAGIDLLRHGAKRGACSEETLVFEDDEGKTHEIIRRRGKSKNEYVLDGQPLLAIGREVPEEIASLLRLSPHAFQLQSDGNFLLCDTDGDVARALSSTVGLTQIDAAFAQIRTRKTENDTALRVSQADVDREQAASDRFSALDDADVAVADAEAVAGMLDAVNADIEGTARLFYGLSALPPDHADQLVWASHYIRNADSAERAVIAAGIVVGDMRRTAEMLGRIPQEPAGIDLLEDLLATAQDAASDAVHETSGFEQATLLLCKLDALRPDIGIMPRRATLLLTQAGAAGGKRIEAEEGIAGMAGLLVRLAGHPAGCQTIGAGGFLTRANELAQKAESATACANDMIGLLNCFGKNDLALEGSLRHMAQFTDEIERYKREHPVCPECGAEQKHWHVA